MPDADDRPARETEEPKPVVDAEPAARNGDSEEPMAEAWLAAGETENGEGATTPRKRTRRGSRGGRNRKRKAPAAAADDETGALATAEPDSADGPAASGEADALRPDVRVDRRARPNREAHGVRYNPAARGRCPRFPRPKA